MRAILGIMFATMAILGVGLATYLGFFKSVQLDEGTKGPYHLLFVENMGPYHKVTAKMDQVAKWAKDQGHKCRLTFGEYLDNPKKMEAERLRSHVGCVLDQPIAVSGKLDSGETLQFSTRPQGNYMTALFEGSPAIGPFKVYSKAFSYIEDQGLQALGAPIEIYQVHADQKSMTTTYLFPVAPRAP